MKANVLKSSSRNLMKPLKSPKTLKSLRNERSYICPTLHVTAERERPARHGSWAESAVLWSCRIYLIPKRHVYSVEFLNTNV